MEKLKNELQAELTQNILPFWLNKMVDHRRGGFLGRIDGHGNPVPDAEKGAVLNARILWAFAAAYRVLGKPEYLEAATRAKQGIKMFLSFLPAAGAFLSLAFIYFYPLSEAKMKQITAELQEKRK